MSGTESNTIAALLTEEMRERIRAATFERVGNRVVMSGTDICPLGVALGLGRSPAEETVFNVLSLGMPRTWAERDARIARRIALHHFIAGVDTGQIAPEDVKPLLLGVGE